MFVELNNEIIKYIENETLLISKNKPLRDSIFDLIEKESVLLRYPLEDEENNGFFIQRWINNEQKNFIFINSAKYITKQIYTAAHEYGHLKSIDLRVKENFLYDEDLENIVNRYASELLMPKNIFINETIKIKKKIVGNNDVIAFNDLNDIIINLMRLYYVPYRAVLFRLGELNFFDRKTIENIEQYEKKNKNLIVKQIEEKKFNELLVVDNVKYISNYSKIISKIKKDKLTFETKIRAFEDLFKRAGDDSISCNRNIEMLNFEEII